MIVFSSFRLHIKLVDRAWHDSGWQCDSAPRVVRGLKLILDGCDEADSSSAQLGRDRRNELICCVIIALIWKVVMMIDGGFVGEDETKRTIRLPVLLEGLQYNTKRQETRAMK